MAGGSKGPLSFYPGVGVQTEGTGVRFKPTLPVAHTQEHTHGTIITLAIHQDAGMEQR